jgi:hypothetical protein
MTVRFFLLEDHRTALQESDSVDTGRFMYQFPY